MSFFQKIKAGISRFMIGRNGLDQLSNAMLITALVLMLLTSFTGSVVLNAMGLFLYGWSIFRSLSRNVAKRRAENLKYVTVRWKIRTSIAQYWARLKNVKKYKYFKCPECQALIRLPRKVGEVTVTCSKCRCAFKKKA